MRIPDSKLPAVRALIDWARDQQAFPEGTPGGEGRGHIDENHRFKLRDLMDAIDAVKPISKRERILAMLDDGPKDSGVIAKALGIHRTDAGHHLYRMREQGRCERVDHCEPIAIWSLTAAEQDRRRAASSRSG